MWKCKVCGEKIEDDFDICWNCGTGKDGSPPRNPNEFGRQVTDVLLTGQRSKPIQTSRKSSIKPERTYYQSGDVLITSTRAEIGGKTFVMSNITSVNLEQNPPRYGCGILLIAGGMLSTIFGFGMGSDSLLLFLLLGVVCVVLGILAYQAGKATYEVNLTSASGEVRVMESTNRQHLEEIIEAIKEAVIDSGVQEVKPMDKESKLQPSGELVQQLTSLKKLLDSGAITTQEYDTVKANLLSKM